MQSMDTAGQKVAGELESQEGIFNIQQRMTVLILQFLLIPQKEAKSRDGDSQ